MKQLALTLFALSFSFISEASDVWTQKANFGGIARHRTTSFSIGNKGYMGLGHYNSGPGGNIHLADFWEYDPASNAWTQKADFGGGLRYHAVGESFGNKAYVGTGRAPGNTLMTDWWEFDPIANTWTAKATFPGTARRGAVCFKQGDYLFVGTGQIPTGFTNDFYAYDPVNDQWLTGVASFPGSPRTSAVAFSIDEKSYVGTGGTGCGTTDFYEYKLSTNQWINRANVGSIIRQEAGAFAVNGKGYIIAGDNCSSGTNYKDFWEYDPNTDTWTELPEFEGAARRYIDAFVIGTKAYVGLGTSGVNYSDLWEYDQTLSILQRDVELLEINTYPNPSTNLVNVQLGELPSGSNWADFTLLVYDISGKIVHNEVFQNSSTTITKDQCGTGLKMVHVIYADQAIRTEKVVFE